MKIDGDIEIRERLQFYAGGFLMRGGVDAKREASAESDQAENSLIGQHLLRDAGLEALLAAGGKNAVVIDGAERAGNPDEIFFADVDQSQPATPCERMGGGEREDDFFRGYAMRGERRQVSRQMINESEIERALP